MRKGTLKSFLEAKKQEVGDNKHLLNRVVKEALEDLFTKGEIKPSQFSIGAIYEETVLNECPHIDRTSNAKDIAEAVSSTQFPVIVGTVIHAALIPEYETAVGNIATLVTEDQATKTAKEDIGGLTDLDNLELRPQSMAYEETDLGEKKVSIYMADFGRIISLTREAIFDDRTGEILRRARNVGKKAGQHRAKMIVQTIEMAERTAFGESSTRAFTYDGSAVTKANFYSSDHSSVIDKQVNANVTSTALSQDGLSALMQNFGNLVDTKGEEIDIVPKILLVPTALYNTAYKLLSSNTDPETVSNDPNPVKGMYKLMQSTFLSSDTQYYLGDFTSQLLWLWVWKPETAFMGADSDLSFRNQIISQFRFNYNGGVGHTDYRHIMRGGA